MKITQFLIASVLLAVSSLAQNIITSGSSTGLVAVAAVARPAAVTGIQIVDTSGSANRVYVRDNSSASTTNIVMPAYKYYTSSSASVDTVFTNYDGVVLTNTHTVASLTLNTNAASTNAARLINIIYVPANGTVTWTPTSSQGTSYGIQLYSAAAMSYQMTYLPLP